MSSSARPSDSSTDSPNETQSAENATNASRLFPWIAALTILISAFLLFQVQPIISRSILPWFGGSPAVWSTCMLFFQLLLLGGYAYAHALSTQSPRVQWMLHAALLLGGVLLLPIIPATTWKPPDSLQPIPRILQLLVVHVGLPYFLLSSTGPLVQSWYAKVEPGSPYRLYALSNVGSLLALLSYPLLVEPQLDTLQQGWIWSGGFAVFAILCAVLAQRFSSRAQSQSSEQLDAQTEPADDASHEIADESRWSLVAWIALPALASVMLLAVTARLCQDVAVSPFMWVAPLSLYLLTFIICFDREAWYRRLAWAILLAVSVMGMCVVMLADELADVYEKAGITLPIAHFDNNVLIESTAALLMLFFACMVCHGEVVRLKPAPRSLTKFYLAISAGGALGGLTVGLLCPLLLWFVGEWNFGIVASFLVAWGVIFNEMWEYQRSDQNESQPTKKSPKRGASQQGPSKGSSRFWQLTLLGLGLCMVMSLLVVFWAQLNEYNDGAIVRKRSFYGVLSIRVFNANDDDGRDEGHGLYNGRILHGYQFWEKSRRRIATTYYNTTSGIGLAIRTQRELAAKDNQQQDPASALRVGVIGLGAGTLAAYGETGDTMRFYEINPLSIELAREHFSFLNDAPSEVETVLGDGRISLENESPQQFDVLALDAFAGDSIPTHLLTAEAAEVYQKHLKPSSVVCIHISNRHLDLAPVVKALATAQQWDGFEIESDGLTSAPKYSSARTASSWIVLSRSPQSLQVIRDLAKQDQSTVLPLPSEAIRWTDRYSNLVQILRD